MSQLDPEAILAVNRAGWNKVASRFYGGTALPQYGPLTVTEDSLGLLGQIAGKTVLEIGCGSGHSLAYLARQGAAELWALDFSKTQIDFATALLEEQGVDATLFISPMEQDPGLPKHHFDLVVSIYALGWTTDLAATLSLIYAYLKPGGQFVFSWEHPIYTCLDYEQGGYRVTSSYHNEEVEIHSSWQGVEIMIPRRRLSTFINAVIASGLQIETLTEGDFNPALVKESNQAPERWYSVQRAQLVPTTFILKARKPF